MTLPLILIAGWGYTAKAMLRLKEALDGHPMDGHPVKVTSTGELWQTQSSGALSCSPGLSRYAVGLHHLLATFGGRVGVIGWSMGGIVALETVREYPGLLQRLVIISGTARFSAGNDVLPALNSVEGPGVSVSVLRAMARGLRRTPDNVLAAYYAKVHAPQGVPMAEVATRSQDIALLDRDELLQGLDYLQRMDVRDGLEKQTVPTLVVHGREDRIVPWQAGEWLSHALPVSHWRCHEGLGHALPIQAAALLAADIRTFLA
ncbi:MAG: alpha/beta hydrolase [Verrucomicrobia bacterium]|nr:alpha/beta hydrolase [Verrucomicrobiota bacterium]MBU1736333.1 alpha/beta hydrolase [Verrucomicrobiota bacterium]MBU1857364.1 alpha/beta hydrolase [Verrucomicrobiota bacterium]